MEFLCRAVSGPVSAVSIDDDGQSLTSLFDGKAVTIVLTDGWGGSKLPLVSMLSLKRVSCSQTLQS